MNYNIEQRFINLKKRDGCRTCGAKIVDFFDFGYLPLAGNFLPLDAKTEEVYSMQVSFCPECYLVQVPNIVDPSVLFNDNYHYLSSVTQTLNTHFAEYAKYLNMLVNGYSKPFIVEFGCNDGVLLNKLSSMGINNLGVDASNNIVNIAREKGLNVICSFFTKEVAEEILEKHGKPTVITGSNVFAHNDNVGEILEAVNILLDGDGFFIVEVHYVDNLIRETQFDFFYHEHCNYYSVQSLNYLLGKYNLEIVDVQRLSMHSGSIRVISKFKGNQKKTDNVANFIDEERKNNLHRVETYLSFNDQVNHKLKDLKKILIERKKNNKVVLGYGASGRSVTFLNYLMGSENLIDFMVDASPQRYNHIMPGLHIPIYDAKVETIQNASTALITAWSYSQEIIAKERWYLEKGNEFIIPLPMIKILKN